MNIYVPLFVVVTCVETAIAEAGCSNFVPESCYCNSLNYTSSLIFCIQSSCASELPTAEDLTQKFCALATNGTTSVSFSITSFTSASSSSGTTSASTSGSGSGTSASGSETSSTGTSSASNAASRMGSFSSVASMGSMGMGVGVALMGVVAGAVLVG
ncbi:hypothetical protein BT96DRAFT_264289 [Gymnopus androsaceus JB14]|uniref:CFEM domain-containing protein n=1 Tax=Gymnopus androsaceus JB14 TaxID=1447944 RepID=A0A6A4H3B6_9AGAR|nr:hypothetical protein BT96DRAFT_264289 [Gymnopus androsaceus JB14]